MLKVIMQTYLSCQPSGPLPVCSDVNRGEATIRQSHNNTLIHVTTQNVTQQVNNWVTMAVSDNTPLVNVAFMINSLIVENPQMATCAYREANAERHRADITSPSAVTLLSSWHP